jgi:hypothetical protein
MSPRISRVRTGRGGVTAADGNAAADARNASPCRSCPQAAPAIVPKTRVKIAPRIVKLEIMATSWLEIE